jgi:hypothetical protein
VYIHTGHASLENMPVHGGNLAAFAICVGGKDSKQTNSRGDIFQSCECKLILCIFMPFLAD